MNRRRVGLLVLALVLLAAVTVPNAVGRTIPGVAQAVPMPGSPSVGQCVGQRFDLGWFMAGGSSAKYRYPELGIGDCGSAHYGEVVSVIATPTIPKILGDSGGGYAVDDKNMDACYQAAAQFLGLRAAEQPDLFGYWRRSVMYPVVPLMPTARQRAAGQHWLACATYLNQLSADGAVSLVGYPGSLRNAVSTGAGRNYLGFCPKEADWIQMSATSCDMPHHGEVFGSGGALPHDVARTTLTSSCKNLIDQVTKNADLIRVGRLVVTVQITDKNGATVKGAMIPAQSNLQCGIVTPAGRLLQGSLIAIGTGPIPWA